MTDNWRGWTCVVDVDGARIVNVLTPLATVKAIEAGQVPKVDHSVETVI